MITFDRYSFFRKNGDIEIVPSITLEKKSSDYYEIYRHGHTRLDILSYNYYGNPNYDWLILMANQEHGSMEFEIPNNTEIRIPYPLEDTLNEYSTKVSNYIKLYKE